MGMQFVTRIPKLEEMKSLDQRHQLPSPRIPRSGRFLRRQNLLQACLQVHLFWSPCPWILPEQDAVTGVQDEEGGNTNVGGEEVGRGPFRREEAGEAVDQSQEDRATHADVHPVGLHAGVVGLFDALHLDGLVPSDVDDAAASPTDKSGGVGEVDQPVKDRVTAAPDREVCEKEEEGRDADRVVRDTPPVAGFENAGGIARHRKTVERAGRHVEEGVSSRPGGCKDGRIDNVI